MDETQALLDRVNACASGCDVHSRGCWGFFVVRTSFEDGDDERVPEAMDRLDTYGTLRLNSTREINPPTPFAAEIDAEALRRHHNTLITDPTLKDASIGQVRAFLSTFFKAIPGAHGGPRFLSVILLDTEVLRNLVALPKNPTLKQWRGMVSWRGKDTQWVKLIDTDEEDGESCRAYVWDQSAIFHMLSFKDVGVAELARLDGDDDDWLFYDGI
ncbi:hypothetical protein K4F52_007206 [Lecanicillium sp. MT-2017a]|nr:hypothetical protein K4F52_007206 [Lecanicillium sp. MT-2017a]